MTKAGRKLATALLSKVGFSRAPAGDKALAAASIYATLIVDLLASRGHSPEEIQTLAAETVRALISKRLEQ